MLFAIEKSVFISRERYALRTPGKMYGRYFRDSGVFNVFPDEMEREGGYLGEILPLGSSPGRARLCGVITPRGIQFYSYGKPIRHELYSLYQDLFSRNSGILETGYLAGKRAVILGCGSVGSLVALELARSGVGNFLLVDPDIVEYHNICRHQCGLTDVGDLKVNALEKRLKNINPSLHIRKFDGIFQDIPKQLLDDFAVAGETVFVGCADNRNADVYSNRISIVYGAAFVSIGFWERAYAGEIFYHIPGMGMPCYQCALGDGGDGMSARAEANHHVYSNEEDLEKVNFEPGISVDINFITCIGIKLILDILNRNRETYRPRLLNHLKQYTLICNTSDPAIGGPMVEIFSYPLQVTTSLKVNFNANCPGLCRHEAEEAKEKQSAGKGLSE